MVTIKSFTDLRVWKEGHRLVILIYRITRILPKSEKYSLTDQMRRASCSITSNIAEGFGRQTYKEKLQFYYLAQGSLTELKNQILIIKDVGYVDREEIENIILQVNNVHKILQGLIKKTKSYIRKS